MGTLKFLHNAVGVAIGLLIFTGGTTIWLWFPWVATKYHWQPFSWLFGG